MDQLTQHTKETIAGLVVHLINQDYVALTKDFVELGFLTPDNGLTIFDVCRRSINSQPSYYGIN